MKGKADYSMPMVRFSILEKGDLVDNLWSFIHPKDVLSLSTVSCSLFFGNKDLVTFFPQVSGEMSFLQFMTAAEDKIPKPTRFSSKVSGRPYRL